MGSERVAGLCDCQEPFTPPQHACTDQHSLPSPARPSRSLLLPAGFWENEDNLDLELACFVHSHWVKVDDELEQLQFYNEVSTQRTAFTGLPTAQSCLMRTCPGFSIFGMACWELSWVLSWLLHSGLLLLSMLHTPLSGLPWPMPLQLT